MSLMIGVISTPPPLKTSVLDHEDTRLSILFTEEEKPRKKEINLVIFTIRHLGDQVIACVQPPLI
jgi:hypothetical protein